MPSDRPLLPYPRCIEPVRETGSIGWKTKRAPRCGEPLSLPRRPGGPALHFHYVFGLKSLGTLFHLELHFSAFVQATITVSLNGGKVNEDVVATGPLDETVTLGGVKPFHNTFFLHYTSPESNRSSCSWVIQARKADFRGLLRTFEARPNNVSSWPTDAVQAATA